MTNAIGIETTDGLHVGARLRLTSAALVRGYAYAVVEHVNGRDIVGVRFEDACDGTDGLLFRPLGRWKVARAGHMRAVFIDVVERVDVPADDLEDEDEAA
jgi:hypothetical protein